MNAPDEAPYELLYKKLLASINDSIEEQGGKVRKYGLWPIRAKNGNRNTSELVLERLTLRHAILSKLVEIESGYSASENYKPRVRLKPFVFEYPVTSKEGAKKQAGDTENGRRSEDRIELCYGVYPEYKIDEKSEQHVRAYRLATTDLFVEKAIAYLEYDYADYVSRGKWQFNIAFIAISIGVATSAALLFPNVAGSILTYAAHFLPNSGVAAAPSTMSPPEYEWIAILESFIKAFTFYGFVVLLAVHCSRLGKAMMDQAERLRERRHSLRQGRLYVHLSNGEVTVEELEKAFDWNVSKGNAFGNIPTESSAPWGSVVKEAIKAIPEAISRARSAAKK